MSTKSPDPGRAGAPFCLALLTLDPALAGLVKVKLAHVKGLEAQAGMKREAAPRKTRAGKRGAK